MSVKDPNVKQIALKLYHLMVNNLTLADVKQLGADPNLDHEQSREKLIQTLIMQMISTGKLLFLVSQCAHLKPNIDWVERLNETSNIRIEGNVGPGTAIGTNSRVKAGIIAGRDVVINYHPVHNLSTTQLPTKQQLEKHFQGLANQPDYRRWADEDEEDYYIPGESKTLPLSASPYDDLSGEREFLIPLINRYQRLLVLGEPGTGKTVALQRVMWEASQVRQELPIFVRMLYFDGDLINSLRLALHETGQIKLSDQKSAQEFLQRIPCLILLDGLNEVPGQLRQTIIVAIIRLVQEFPKHRYIITSRSQDSLWKGLRGGGDGIVQQAVVVQRITDIQARDYLKAHLGQHRGKDLHDRLNNRLRGLSRTPLLLWLIKEAGEAGDELPGNRGELFDRFVDRLFNRDKEKLKPLRFTSQQKKESLAGLAFMLQQKHLLACSRREAITYFSEIANNEAAHALLREVLIHGLVEGEQQIRFLHQSLQEYFVALFLNRMAQEERHQSGLLRIAKLLRRQKLSSLAQDDWWTESFVQLAGLTNDPDWLVREIFTVKPWLAFWCSIEGQPVDDLLKTSIEQNTVGLLNSPQEQTRLGVIGELGRMENPRTIPYLVQALEDNSYKVVQMATSILERLGEPTVEFLQSELNFAGTSRLAATRILGKIWQFPEIFQLGSGIEHERVAGARAISKLEQSTTVPVLQSVLLYDTSFAVRREAAVAIAKYDSESLHWLRTIMTDAHSNWQIPLAAASALGSIGDKGALTWLFQKLDEGDSRISSAALKELQRHGKFALQIILNKYRLGFLDVKQTESLLPLLISIETPDLLKIIEPLTQHIVPRIRRLAIHAISHMETPDAIDVLLNSLRDANLGVRKEAKEGLVKIGKKLDDDYIAYIMQALKQEYDPYIRSIIDVLVSLGPMAVDKLVQGLTSSQYSLYRYNIAVALGKIGNPAIGPLISILANEDLYIRQAAIKALEIIGKTAIPSLTRVSQTGNEIMNQAANEAIVRIHNFRDPTFSD